MAVDARPFSVAPFCDDVRTSAHFNFLSQGQFEAMALPERRAHAPLVETSGGIAWGEAIPQLSREAVEVVADTANVVGEITVVGFK